MAHFTIDNLKVSAKGNNILNNISLTIPDNSIVAIIGPSGCGKTTMLRCLNRLIEQESSMKVEGNIFLDNENIYDENYDLINLRKKVGFIAQRPFPLPYSIFDNVAFGAKIHKMKKLEILNIIKSLEPEFNINENRSFIQTTSDLVEICLKKAGLWNEVKDRLEQPAKALSIGQQQRLTLARALSIGSKIILADEPTSALDPISTRMIEEQLITLKSQISIVMVTHILRQARRLADYVVFMYMGELIEHGPATEFFSNPKNQKTQAYIKGEII